MGALGNWRPGTKVDSVEVKEKIRLGHYRVVLKAGNEERHTEVSEASESPDRRSLARALARRDEYPEAYNSSTAPPIRLALARVADRIWASLPANGH